MIRTIAGVKVAQYFYPMPEGFADAAIAYSIEICKKPNVFHDMMKQKVGHKVSVDLISNSPNATLWNVDDNDKRLFRLPLFKDFLSFLKPHMLNYIKELEIDEKDVNVVGMWAVHYKPKQFVARHNHFYSDCAKRQDGTFIERIPHKSSNQNDMISILLYLNKPIASGNLFIEMPDGDAHEFDLKAGDVIMFPSYSLMHWTSPNESDEDKFEIGRAHV